MHSIVTVASPVARPMFTTVDVLRAELGSLLTVDDSVLETKIQEASGDIELAVGFRVPQEDAVETFWHNGGADVFSRHACREGGEPLFLRRKNVTAIASVTLDGDALDPSEYRLDPDAGVLYRFDASSGYPRPWTFSKSIAVACTAGYVLPPDPDANLPPAIASCTKKLVKSFCLNLSRDQMLRSESVPGVMEFGYWVGTVGDPEKLPSEILAELALVRRPRLAVA
ncbi:hypothetical protein [Bradyrhizobium elkanii]|uniref:hypothetical protein n=1 Tax=Bradyrhizobium elkanii TaxID=29448 RepID=UPI000841DD2A|nr:hypothetical protein [Bradyrhizobium elkanii]ODM71684.1 hypothetical protein A6X20_07005 [Bradyrhizobium elkanii]ODM79056.1 hypothetical protein A6452_28590 [Bradyrhizobium elkanii]